MLWLWLLWLWGNEVSPKKNTNVAVVKQTVQDQGPDPIVAVLMGLQQGSPRRSEKPGSVPAQPMTARQVSHRDNRDKVMAVYGPELDALEGLTPEEALAISPKQEPSRTWRVTANCQDTVHEAKARLWAPYGDLELVSDPEPPAYFRWLLHALEEAAPSLPPDWSRFSVAQRYQWMNTENFVAIGLRMSEPEPNAPIALKLRPRSYFIYFQEQHDWCDPYHQDGNGNCRARNTEIATPLTLALAKGGQPITWQVDYHIGEIGAYKDGWRREQKQTVFGQYAAPSFQEGAAQFSVAPLPDVVAVELVCR